MDLATLELFIDVAHHGGFAEVARRRGVDPSAVSRAIAGLEAQLDIRLFQRTTRRMALTDAGATYLARISPLLAELEAAGDEAKRSDGPAGRLRLTASAAYGEVRLVPLLPVFRAAFPQLRIELLLTDANLDLVAEQVDLAIRLGPSPPPGAIGVKLHGMDYGVYASPAYLASAPRLAQPGDLAAHRCLLFAGPLQRREWLFATPGGGEQKVAVDGDIAISAPLSLKAAAVAGLGPAVLPNWLVAADVAAGRLVAALPGHIATTTSFGSGAWLYYPTRAHLPAKVRATIDFLKQALAD